MYASTSGMNPPSGPYLGLDEGPSTWEAPARSGRISQARQRRRPLGAGRGGLEARSCSPARPAARLYDRTRACRGDGKAIVATARKLAALFWCILTRGEDYAHQQASLTKKKLRRLEITAGAPRYAETARGILSVNVAIRQAKREARRTGRDHAVVVLRRSLMAGAPWERLH